MIPEDVARNRAILAEGGGFPDTPLWLNQVHGTDVAILDDNTPRGPQADAVYTRTLEGLCDHDGGLPAGTVLFP